jgi:hypothetical protein
MELEYSIHLLKQLIVKYGQVRHAEAFALICSKLPNKTKDEIICPTCKVPRAYIAYSKLEDKYKCIYCNTTWAANKEN